MKSNFYPVTVTVGDSCFPSVQREKRREKESIILVFSQIFVKNTVTHCHHFKHCHTSFLQEYNRDYRRSLMIYELFLIVSFTGFIILTAGVIA